MCNRGEPSIVLSNCECALEFQEYLLYGYCSTNKSHILFYVVYDKIGEENEYPHKARLRGVVSG
jgi:hypothetical protein